MNVKQYIDYVKNIDLKTIINVNNVDLNDDIDKDVKVSVSFENDVQTIDLHKK